jgi:hypothetical protein
MGGGRLAWQTSKEPREAVTSPFDHRGIKIGYFAVRR